MAAITFDVRHNMDAVLADLQRVSKEVVEKATVISLNKMAAQIKTAAASNIRSAGYKLKAADVKRGLVVKKAYAGKLSASVVASGKPIPLIAYGTRKTAKGVSVDVLNGRKIIAHAFIAIMPSGHKGVYVRAANSKHKPVNKGNRKTWSALPIKELFGPSIPDGLANAEVQRLLQSFIEEKFPLIFAHEVGRLNK